MRRRLSLLLAAFSLLLFPASALAQAHQVHALKITVLSTMLADGDALGEWGYSALVEVDGHKILFDTGAHPDLVLKNARTGDSKALSHVYAGAGIFDQRVDKQGKEVIAGHCTGIEATYKLRALLGLDRKAAVVSAVGSSFTLGKGIDPGEIAG